MAINKPDFLAGYSLFYESARYGGDFMAAIENNRDFSLSPEEPRMSTPHKKNKRKLHLKLPLVVIWCGGRDSNSHRLTPTTPSK